MGTYLQNSKLASAAASYYSGIQMARTEAIRRNVRTQFVLTDTPVSTADLGNAAGAAISGSNWVVRAGVRAAGVRARSTPRPAREGDGSAGAAAIQVTGCGVCAGRLRRHDPVQRLRRHRRRRAVLDRHLEPRGRHVRPSGGRSAAGASRFRPAGRSPRAIRPRRRQETAVRAPDPRRLAPAQGGFFLIEAMVAILIFALGILGLVAMGGTAVSSQSDAQYRTEASSLADAIAGEIALGIDRTERCQQGGVARSASRIRPTRRRRRCRALRVQRRRRSMPAPRRASPTLLSRAANLGPAPGLPGSDRGQPADLRRRAPATSTASRSRCAGRPRATAPRHHTLVTYVN